MLVPQIAADRASAALVQASSPSPGSLQQAQAEASQASQLDPLSDQGLLAQASVAAHRHDLGGALADLRQAVARNPSDIRAWGVLATVEEVAGNMRAAAQADQHAIDLDPYGRVARGTLRSQLQQAPVKASATHWPTPLR